MAIDVQKNNRSRNRFLTAFIRYFKNSFQGLSKISADYGNSIEEYRILILKILIFQIIFIYSSFIPYHFSSENYFYLALNCLFIILNAAILGLIRSRRTEIAKSVFISLNYAAIFIFSILLGPEANLDIALLSLIAVPVLLIDMHKWKLILCHLFQSLIYYYLTRIYAGFNNLRFGTDPAIVTTIGQRIEFFSLINLFGLTLAFGLITTLADSQDKKLNLRLALENHWIKLIQNLTILANSEQNFVYVLEKSLNLMLKDSRFNAGHVVLIRKIENTIEFESCAWVSAGFVKMDRLISAWNAIKILDDFQFATAIYEGMPIWQNVSEKDPRGFKDLLNSGLSDIFLLPVTVKDEVVALFSLFNDKPNDADRNMAVNLGQIIGTQIGRVAERNRAQVKLDESHKHMIRSARLAALGEMAGGIAHEINNPLAIIQAHISRISRSPGREDVVERIEESSKAILATVDRMSKIINGLKSVARESTNEPYQTIKVKILIQDALELAGHRFGELNIKLNMDPINDEFEIECRPTQILQILVNLLNNAFDAVSKQRQPWVYVEVDHLDEMVEIAINDSGPGVSDENRNRIMEAFFTTKPLGKGTGLGLSISKSIAEGHLGSLILDQAALNTRFVLSLPLQRISQTTRKIDISALEISPEMISYL